MNILAFILGKKGRASGIGFDVLSYNIGRKKGGGAEPSDSPLVGTGTVGMMIVGEDNVS